MTFGTTYVLGAGLAGLSASVALAGRGHRIELIESAGQAGGRCRSYFDSALNQVIDNGNHLVLSGNHATMAYLHAVGSRGMMSGSANADASFVDIRSGERWTISPSDGSIPYWLLDSSRRVPETTPLDYLGLVRLLFARGHRTIAEVLPCRGALWERLLHPFLLAALNTEPRTSSAALAANLIRETFAKGGRAYRPHIATPNLAAAFVDPALRYLGERGASIRLGERVRRIVLAGGTAQALETSDRSIVVAPDDVIIVATPPWVAGEWLPGIAVPNRFSAIVNAHFKIAPPPGAPAMLGVLGATAEWIFAFPDRISVTVSGADRLVDLSRETLADTLWKDVAAALGMSAPLPPWQIVKEKRATFAATPEQAARRPKPLTPWRNLILAGDWTATGLPSTIEGAIRSGQRAADLAWRQRAV
jgi:squalene-associated FAD-dependent desaturase